MPGGGGSSESTTSGTMGFATMIDPQYGFYAAQAQEQAANAASMLATTQTNNALASLQHQFTTATQSLAPYTSTGTEALDKLNRYLGLGAYKPNDLSSAPKAPTMIHPEVDHSDVLNYIHQNLTDVNGKQYYGGVGMGSGLMSPEEWQGASMNDPSAQGNVGLENTIRSYLTDKQNKIYQPFNDAQQSLYDEKMAAYNDQKQTYDKQMALYDQYNGMPAATGEEVQQEITKDPNYQFQLDQGIKGLAANSSAAGYLGSGRMLKELQTFGSGLAANAYGSMLSNLAQLAGAGQQAATQQSNLLSGLGQNNAQLYSQLGDTQANAALAAGQARSSAFLNAGTYIKPLIGSTTTKSSSSGGAMSGIGQIAGLASGLAGMF